jgi:proteasome lid subunit RPN8/RPN11
VSRHLSAILTSDELERARAQAAAEYPAECCGVVLTRTGEPPQRIFFPCRNVQDQLHARDPERHPRDARTAYYIDPRDLLSIGRREAEGYRVATIYHSHIDAGAYFSETDRRNALIDGDPAYPDAVYVVMSVVSGRVDDVKAYAWDPGRREFAVMPLSTENAKP